MKYFIPIQILKIDIKALLLLVVVLYLFSSCDIKPRDIPEPNYNPHVLKPGKYVPSKGKLIDLDSFAKPKYLIPEVKYVKAGKPKFIPETTNYHQVGKPEYYPVKGKVINMDSVAKPKYIPTKGKKVPSSWPEWIPAQPEYSANTPLPFYYLNLDNGLNEQWVTCLLEDRMGRILIGTAGGGVSLWDGAGFSHFTMKEGLVFNKVQCLLEDNKGRIWIGTMYGLSCWDGHGFTNYTKDEGLIDNNILCLLKDRKGDIWIGTQYGLSVFDGQGFTNYTTEEGLGDNIVCDILEDSNGNILIGGSTLTLWDGNTFAHYKELNGRGILEDQEGNIWIGSATWGDGFKKWNGHGYYYYSNTNGLKYKAVRTLFQDRLGKIWISTYDEQKVLSVWDEKGFRHITVDDGLAINAILVFMQDRSGNIWMGGFEGISVLMRDGITRFDYKKIKSSQLEHFDDSPDGKIWISQFGQGIFVWEGHNEKTGKAGFSHYTTNEGLSSNHIAFTSADHSGRKWITSFNGLQMWDGIGFTHYSNLPGIGNIDAKDLLIDR
ncbi:MAG: hypothetical protein KAQ62_16895, partial [Cyclobacteriaceae bacterium]|nr:hypothetical protein [Cyclobacteriaceae bacterium]